MIVGPEMAHGDDILVTSHPFCRAGFCDCHPGEGAALTTHQNWRRKMSMPIWSEGFAGVPRAISWSKTVGRLQSNLQRHMCIGEGFRRHGFYCSTVVSGNTP